MFWSTLDGMLAARRSKWWLETSAAQVPTTVSEILVHAAKARETIQKIQTNRKNPRLSVRHATAFYDYPQTIQCPIRTERRLADAQVAMRELLRRLWSRRRGMATFMTLATSMAISRHRNRSGRTMEMGEALHCRDWARGRRRVLFIPLCECYTLRMPTDAFAPST